ncbi:MAG TPA: phosphatidate cytidylyltransferase [Gemmatimonadaceae bacterium]
MSSELTRRVLVAVIAAPVAIVVLVVGGAWLAALISMTAALAAWEFFRIARGAGLAPLERLGVALAGVVPLVVHARFLGLYDPNQTIGAASVASLVFLVILGACIWARGVAGKPLGAAASTTFGIAYTGGMLSFGLAIWHHEYAFAPASLSFGSRALTVPSGGLLLLLPVFVTWASDIGAFAVGRVVGRHKLIPSVSPGKTVEGAIGGLVASMLVAWLYVQFVLRPAAHLGFSFAPWGVFTFGAIVSVAAQIGDLTESLLKREAGVKDSSHLIPGHGGILDRFDSLLFVLPVAYVVLGAMLTWAP